MDAASPHCPHHALDANTEWAESNRLLCNFIHRGIVPPTREPTDPEFLRQLLTPEPAPPVAVYYDEI